MIHVVKCPSCGNDVETYQNPFPTVDIVVIRNRKVLLIERKNPPQGWALPGGFIDCGETAESAAVRELREETGLTASRIDLLGVYSNPDRDPCFHTMSVVYIAQAEGEVQAGDDAKTAEWFPFNQLPTQIAFDHRRIVSDAVNKP